jgi:NTE family protein
MRTFWKRVEHGYVFDDILPSLLSSPLRNWLAVSTGIAGFFKPRALAFLSPYGQKIKSIRKSGNYLIPA